MDIKLYNTLTHKKTKFTPIKEKQVSIYTCGPTVYGYAHIGNMRAYIFMDNLRRMFKYNILLQMPTPEKIKWRKLLREKEKILGKLHSFT